MKGTESWDFLLNPIADWNKFDVLGYLKSQGIPIPEARQGKTATGLDLSMASLRHLHDTHPDDFERLSKYFPHAGAVIAHREFFGDDK